LYEEGLELPEGERRQKRLGYRGLAAKFGIPVRTVRSYLSYERRAYYQGRCADMFDKPAEEDTDEDYW
ncbi:MAG: hypothetical protein ACE5FA_01330, partial [Dehalococcoidia bacterium]